MSTVATPRMSGVVGGGFPRSGVGVSTWEELSTVWVAFRREWLSTLPAATITTKTATSPPTIFNGATALLGGLGPSATPGIVGISALKRSSGVGDWSAMKRSSKAAICCVAMTQLRLRAQGANVPHCMSAATQEQRQRSRAACFLGEHANCLKLTCWSIRVSESY